MLEDGTDCWTKPEVPAGIHKRLDEGSRSKNTLTFFGEKWPCRDLALYYNCFIISDFLAKFYTATSSH